MGKGKGRKGRRKQRGIFMGRERKESILTYRSLFKMESKYGDGKDIKKERHMGIGKEGKGSKGRRRERGIFMVQERKGIGSTFSFVL